MHSCEFCQLTEVRILELHLSVPVVEASVLISMVIHHNYDSFTHNQVAG